MTVNDDRWCAYAQLYVCVTSTRKVEYAGRRVSGAIGSNSNGCAVFCSMIHIQKLFTAATCLLVLSWSFGFNPFSDSPAESADTFASISPASAMQGLDDGFASFQQQQHVLPDVNNILTFVEPIDATPFSLGHLQNQLRSFFTLFDIKTLAEFVFITSAEGAAAVKQTVAEAIQQHEDSAIPDSLFRYLTYAECAEELNPNSKAYVSGASTSAQQQLARLACAKHIKTPFYLNLESGVFFARSSDALSFFKQSNCSTYSAVCNANKDQSYQAKNDIYPITERDLEQKTLLVTSAALLQTAVALDWRPAIGVMPQVFSTAIALQMDPYLRQQMKVDSWQSHLLKHAYPMRRSKRQSLSVVTPLWDAYNLYWLYATRACAFDNYHAPGSVLQATALWTQDMFDQWTACDMFHQPLKTGIVSLVHPDVGIPPSSVWSKMQPCLPQP